MAPTIKLGSRAQFLQLHVTHRLKGFAYLAVLFLVAAISISIGVVSQHAYTLLKREKELEWFFVGQQYQRAIASYYQQSPNGLKELPNKVEDLVLDKRFIAPTRHLRKAYADPLTGEAWGQVTDEDGKISGFYSRSQQPVFLVHQLQQLDLDLSEVHTHADVVFRFKPTAAPSGENDLDEASNIEQDDLAPNITIENN
jgi:hypothetical protein